MEKTLNQRLLDYIAAAPTAFHAVAETAAKLAQAGFLPVNPAAEWNFVPGGKYYLTANDSTLIAFRVPKSNPTGFVITATHSDAPAFKVKAGAERMAAGHYVQLNTERYGGVLVSTWFDRPLGLAGRVLVEEEGGIASRLVHPTQDVAIIPSVAPHLNSEANNGFQPKLHIETFPLCAMVENSGGFRSLIAREAGVSEEAVLGYDLYMVCRDHGAVIGLQQEFLSAPRLDDLTCAFGCLEGFLRAGESDAVAVYCLFDNEEVSSNTKQGAGSSLLYSVLCRVARALGCDVERLFPNSFLVSADNAHAIHPNHPEFSDRDNAPVLNSGLVIKHNAMQRYTTDGVSSALLLQLCRDANVPVQFYANRSDLPGGSTLGSIATTKVPIRAIDIGLPQLAMHSCYETMGAEDLQHLVRAMTALYSHSLVEESGRWRWRDGGEA